MDPKLPIRSLDYTVIFTRQMARMTEFYGSTMGFRLLRSLSQNWHEYLVGANILVLAAPGTRFRGAPQAPGSTSVQLAFRVAPQEVDVCAATLRERGVAIVEPPTDQRFGHRTLFFHDPDGNILEIYAEIWPPRT